MQLSNKVSRNEEEFQGIAVVSDEIVPLQGGRVKFRATWWPAVCAQNICIMTGALVKVVGLENITLLVEPHSQQDFIHSTMIN